MKIALFTMFFCVGFGVILAQDADGDYRTKLSGGSWHTASNWQVYYNGGWKDLAGVAAGPFRNIIPTSASGKIAVRHSMTIVSVLSVNQLTITGTGRLTLNNVGANVVFVDDATNPP